MVTILDVMAGHMCSFLEYSADEMADIEIH